MSNHIIDIAFEEWHTTNSKWLDNVDYDALKQAYKDAYLKGWRDCIAKAKEFENE